MKQQIKQVLIKFWGYSSFRPQQEEIILSVLTGHDTLALLPTGGGKSLTFQVPSLVMPGICLVITPLISLMKDQVLNLQKKGIPAQAIYSGMSPNEIKYILENTLKNEIKFLYISPERAASQSFRWFFEKMDVSLIAVDEAHCISQWGYDFRPPYLRIAELRAIKPQVPILALTATATVPVVKDIQDKLLFSKSFVFQSSFFRQNLSYEVYRDENKTGRVLEILNENPGTSIIYVRNRKKTKEIAFFLLQNKISADFYHAGLSPEERDKKQFQWTSGKTRVMVSTNAFGMGIDKPDVRLVLHVDVPDSIESYFQEAGRAGRDLKNSKCIFLYNELDIEQAHTQFRQSFPPKDFIVKVYGLLGNYFQLPVGSGADTTFDFSLHAFTEAYNLPLNETFYSLSFLEKQQLISLSDAAHNPAKVLIIADKNDLYRFQVEHQSLDPLIKMILRNFPGVFNDYIPIQEDMLAKKLNTDYNKIVTALQTLDKLKIISYVPLSDKPKITFLTPRINERDVRIDSSIYETRFNILKERLNAIIDYITSTAKCRSEILLNYFGETKTKRCGICDVCMERNKLTLSQLEFDSVVDMLKPQLRLKEMSLAEVFRIFKTEEKVKVEEVLKWLVDNKKIEIKDNKLSWTKKD